MNVTIYEGFNKNRGDYSLEAILDGIRRGRWSKTVENIRQALLAGDNEKADRLKKGLPAFTFSATYSGSRKRDNLTGYEGRIMLDVDKLDADQVAPVAWAAADCPYTQFCFLSPSGRGVKIGVDPLAVADAPLVDHPLTVENHKATYCACATYYEKLLGVPVDPSGKDPGRLCFVSYDPDLYLNVEAMRMAREREPVTAKEETAPEVKSPVAKTKETVKTGTEKKEETPVLDACSTLAALKRIRTRTTASCGRYAEGNRNNYVFRFACLCCERNIPKEETMGYCRDRFKDLGETELAATVESGYQTVAETPVDRKEIRSNAARREEQVLAHAERWLLRHYDLRFNVITRFVEYRRLGSKKAFQPLDDQAENSIWRALQHDGIPIRLTTLHTLLISDFCEPFDPFHSYFGALPSWDGETDHIRVLAETVEVNNPELWYKALRRFLVAMVASALDKEVVNHTVLVLASDQGKGKTTWSLNLIPPELHAYRFSGIPDPRSKDSAAILARCLLVNLDELGTLSMKELNPLKEMITKSVIHMRPAYGRNMEHFPRIASFTGSVNSTQVFSDITGSRRFASFEARRIDYLSAVDYTGVYSQVMALYREGFRFWLDDTEIEEMNTNNEEFRIRTPEEELFHTWVCKPEPGDTNIEYLTSTQILTVLCYRAPIQMSHSALTRIGMILKKEGFEHFIREKKRVYAVVIRTQDVVNTEKTQGKDISSENTQSDDTDRFIFR